MLVTRTHITKGPNFDILVGIDLLDPEEINKLWIYIVTCKPACGIIATLHRPECILRINRLLHWHSWMDSRDISAPLGELGAQVAEYQLNQALHFIAENPQGSELWDLPSWRRVLARDDIVRCTIHQCMVGLRDPQTKLRVKKPTDCVASAEIPVKNLR